MELLYLLCSIVSTLITSLSLSLLLPFRFLLHRLRPSASSSESPPVSLYEGTVWHQRRRPVQHSFQYTVRYALFDLDHAPHVPPDHLSSDQARRIAETAGPVFLLTIPPSVGYEQNPLSLYYCYDLEGSSQNLKKCIAEVTNTPWGERVSFVFNPSSDSVAKPLHVSPFMDMLGSWCIRANAPGDSLFVAISVHHPNLGDYFTAALTAKRISTSSVADNALFFWLMPHKVAFWIYWHALKLWWKSVPFIHHPKYLNSSYKEDALMRDQKLQNDHSIVSNKDKCPLFEAGDSELVISRSQIRCFIWRDASWPWS